MLSKRVVEYGVQLTTINCGECGGTYAINERYRTNRERDGDGWHCPYCKIAWGYFGNGTVENLEKELTQMRKRKEWAEQEAKNAEHRRRGEKAAKTRIKNRISNGVCPCCNRTFQNLHRHMQNQHPDYGESR